MGQIIGEGITFDDVLLVPSYSEVIPNQVDWELLQNSSAQAVHHQDRKNVE